MAKSFPKVLHRGRIQYEKGVIIMVMFIQFSLFRSSFVLKLRN